MKHKIGGYPDDGIFFANPEPLRIIQGNGEDFIVITGPKLGKIIRKRFILQDSSLMEHIGESLKAHLERNHFFC